jgi:hypothetical protein
MLQPSRVRRTLVVAATLAAFTPSAAGAKPVIDSEPTNGGRPETTGNAQVSRAVPDDGDQTLILVLSGVGVLAAAGAGAGQLRTSRRPMVPR